MDMDNIEKFFVRIYGIWVLAGLIVWVLNLAIIWLTGTFIDIFVELVISAVIDMFFFPFNLIVAWIINPNPILLIFRIAVFIVLLYFLEIRE